jgi:hypothetical protein
MDRFPKCPKCSASIDKKTSALPEEKWPTPGWPIYECKSCGTLLEEDNRNLIYQRFVVVLMIFLANGVLAGLVFWVSGSETAANVIGWAAVGGLLYWYFTKPVRLAEWGQYAKHE